MKLALVAFLAFLAVPWARSAPSPRLRSRIAVGFSPAERTDVNGQRFAAYLRKKTGLAADVIVASDYDTLVEALKAGKIDFAFLPPFSFVRAEETAGARLLLKAVRKGQNVYYGAVVTRADSGLRRLEDLQGKHIAWVDRSSATGFLMPRAELNRKTLDPDVFFGRQTFAGSHKAVVNAVVGKEADAGATWVNDQEGKYGAWHLYLRKPGEAAQIRMIYVSDPLPGDAFVTTQTLLKAEPAMVEKVTKAVQRMGEATDGQQILRYLYGIDKMAPAFSKEFDPVRKAAKAADPRKP